MTIEVRRASTDDIPATVRNAELTFGFTEDTDSDINPFQEVFGERDAFVATDGDVVVGTAAAFEQHVTLPGGASASCPGVTMITVLPSHRRRGVLRSMMGDLLDAMRDRGEIVTGLTASEGSIYGRFGFGRATESRQVTLLTPRVQWHDEAPAAGDVRIVELGELADVAPRLHEARRSVTSGMMSRTSRMWERTLADVPSDRDGASRLFAAVHRGDNGADDGLMTWRVVNNWGAESAPNEVRVRMLLAPDPAVELAMWRFASEFDLVGKVVAERPMVEALEHALVEPRAVRTTGTNDQNWLRILDPVEVFRQREYLSDGRFVIGFADPFLDDLTGHYLVEVDGGAASVSRTTDAADFTADAAEWASIMAGNADPRAIAVAGRGRGDAARAAEFFRTSQVPWNDVHY